MEYLESKARTSFLSETSVSFKRSRWLWTRVIIRSAFAIDPKETQKQCKRFWKLQREEKKNRDCNKNDENKMKSSGFHIHIIYKENYGLDIITKVKIL